MNEVLTIIHNLLQEHESLRNFVYVVVLARTINKPLFSYLEKYVGKTERKDDDKVLKKIKESKAYKSISWFLDFTLSIKLPKKK